MGISFHSHLQCNRVIATKFCTWHDNCVVVAYANIVAIWWPATELQQGEISIEFELRAKIVSETGPWTLSNSLARDRQKWYLTLFISKGISRIDNPSLSCAIVVRWITYIRPQWWLNNCSGNGLMPTDQKPLFKLMLTKWRHLAWLWPKWMDWIRNQFHGLYQIIVHFTRYIEHHFTIDKFSLTFINILIFVVLLQMKIKGNIG